MSDLVISALISAVIAAGTAFFTSRYEIKRQTAAWAREDRVQKKTAYSDMLQAVGYYASRNGFDEHKAALNATMHYLSLCEGEEWETVNKLAFRLEDRTVPFPYDDFDAVKQLKQLKSSNKKSTP